jgi:hypothetical protein
MHLLLFAGAVAAITLLVPVSGMAAGSPDSHDTVETSTVATTTVMQVPYLGCGSHRVFDPRHEPAAVREISKPLHCGAAGRDRTGHLTLTKGVLYKIATAARNSSIIGQSRGIEVSAKQD